MVGKNYLCGGNMKGKTVSLICKIFGVFFAICGNALYIILVKNVEGNVIIAIGLTGLVIANMALPVDISKILTVWRETK